MKKWLNIILFAAIFLLISWSIIHFIQSKDSSDQQDNADDGLIVAYPDEDSEDGEDGEIGLGKGNEAPDFELENLEGEKVSLSDHLGEKVIVNFWATWCPPCREEIPDFVKLYEEVDDVEILAVNMTASETSSMEKIESFVYDEFEMPFPVLLDKEDETTELYRVAAYPTSYLIDSEGIIQQMSMGAMTYDQMKEALAQMD